MLIINSNGTYRYVFPNKTAAPDIQQWLRHQWNNLGLQHISFKSFLAAALSMAAQIGVSPAQLSDEQLKTTVNQQISTSQPTSQPTQDGSIVSDSIMGKYPENFMRIMREHILPNEGGYVNDPADHGGETNFGLTRRKYVDWKKKNQEPGETDMHEVPASHLYAIYYRDYWKPVRGDELDYNLAAHMFDWGINSGPARAIKHLQRILGLPETGKFDDVLMDKVYKSDQDMLAEQLSQSRLKFISDGVASGKINKKFKGGLDERVNRLPH